ncbi:MAG: hypothetical protein D5S00_10065 [Tindallia sp. MSAO_Bac2]|nr:MAG: hypothetical protein D5S00_10065 [Tindallia sp. MSAO_Bac2]
MKKRRSQQNKQEENQDDFVDSDEHFYYIAGYTSGGVPYGITWEEAIKNGMTQKGKINDECDDDEEN